MNVLVVADKYILIGGFYFRDKDLVINYQVPTEILT